MRSLYAMKDTPDIRLIELEDHEQVISRLQGGDAEIGFYTGRPAKSPGLVSEAVSLASVGLYGKPSLVRRLKSDIQQIASAPMIMPLAGSRAARWQSSELAKAGLDPTNDVCRRSSTLSWTWRQRVSVGILFDGYATRHIKTGRLAKLPVDFERTSMLCGCIDGE
jgi:DNA-binding transcriptional LysR family regulator